MNSQLNALEPNAIVAALAWLQSVLVGSVAASVAIIAVGWFGLMLMSGRLPSRRGVEIILACFILFGASSIAAGIVREFSGMGNDTSANPTEPPALVVTPAVPAPARPVSPYDPYAGAALPPRR